MAERPLQGYSAMLLIFYLLALITLISFILLTLQINLASCLVETYILIPLMTRYDALVAQKRHYFFLEVITRYTDMLNPCEVC